MKDEIIYKSKYSLVCELVGHPKPATQEAEDYCQLVELQNDTWRTTLPRMLMEWINKIKK